MLSLLLGISTVAGSNVNWEVVLGQFNQIQVDPDNEFVCGTTLNHTILCSANTVNISWYEAPQTSQFTQISISDRQIFAVDTENQIFYSSSIDRGNISWRQIPGNLSQISFDGHSLCGTLNNSISCAISNITTSPKWFQIPGNMKQVEVGAQKLFGLDGNGTLNYLSSLQNSSWTSLNQTLTYVQYDGSTLCGITTGGDVVCANEDLSTNPDWDQLSGVSGNLSAIANSTILANSTEAANSTISVNSTLSGNATASPVTGKSDFGGMFNVVSIAHGGLLFALDSNNTLYTGTFLHLNTADFIPLSSCETSADCGAGMVCLDSGFAKICGDAESGFTDHLTPALAKRWTDKNNWRNATLLPQNVVMGSSLVTFAHDSYQNPPAASIGDYVSLTPQVQGSERHTIMKTWNWLSFTIYGNATQDKYVIAFKGTQSLREINTDLAGARSDCQIGDLNCGKVFSELIQVHSGFLAAYMALRVKLNDAMASLSMTTTSQIHITGHSLGGALTILCAADLAYIGYNLQGVATFGCPRVGDSNFEKTYYDLIVGRNILSSRFAAINPSQSSQDMITQLAPLTFGKYSRPVNNVIVGVSPGCNETSFFIPCEARLHKMESSYLPMMESLNAIALQQIATSS